MRKKDSPLAIAQRMSRRRRLFSFSCLRSAKFKYTQIEQSSQMAEIDERMRQ